MVSPASPAWAAVSWPNDPARRRSVAVGGYSSTAVLAGLTGAATATWHVGLLRAGAWAARGLRVPARNALLADIAPPGAYGRAYGFERAMDNLGAIAGPLLALGLVAAFGTRTAIGLSVISGLLAAAAIVYAIRKAPKAAWRERQPLRLRHCACESDNLIWCVKSQPPRRPGGSPTSSTPWSTVTSPSSSRVEAGRWR